MNTTVSKGIDGAMLIKRKNGVPIQKFLITLSELKQI